MNLKDLNRLRAIKSVKVSALKQHDAHYILVKPLQSEKAYTLSTNGVYVFKVHKKANKNDIKQAFKSLYDKTPVSVNIANMPTKHRFNRVVKRSYKKAMITLAPGETIELG